VRHARARSTPAPQPTASPCEVQGHRPPAPAGEMEPYDRFHMFPIEQACQGDGPRPAGDSTLLCMPRAGGEQGLTRIPARVTPRVPEDLRIASQSRRVLEFPLLFPDPTG
jgi:hypothetical protein